MKRMVIGGVAGGVVMFIWGAVSHMVLPLGEAGLSTLPNERTVLESLASSIPSNGLYFFPGMGLGKGSTAEEKAAWESKYRTGPTGLLLYHAKGGAPLSPAQLMRELLSNMAAALIAAWLASRLMATYALRTAAISLLGLFGWISISVSYWNWYGYPSSFILAEGVDQVVGWLLAGLAIARIVPPIGRVRERP